MLRGFSRYNRFRLYEEGIDLLDLAAKTSTTSSVWACDERHKHRSGREATCPRRSSVPR
jgi:hypothetical protein